MIGWLSFDGRTVSQWTIGKTVRRSQECLKSLVGSVDRILC